MSTLTYSWNQRQKKTALSLQILLLLNDVACVPPIFITNVEPELSQQAFHPIAVFIIMTVTFSMSWNVGKIFISGLGIIEILDC